jgi:hypothetical protein
MTNEEYQQKKDEVKKRLGEPTYDVGLPTNESARELDKLRRQKQIESRQKNRIEEAADIALADKVNSVSKAIPIELTDNDLLPFDETEQKILRIHCADTNLDWRAVARLAETTTHKVTSLVRSGRYKVLADKLFNHLAPMMAQASILKAMKGGNTQVTLRVAEHFNILKSEELKIVKPIDDPELLRKLKEIGDQTVTDGDR